MRALSARSPRPCASGRRVVRAAASSSDGDGAADRRKRYAPADSDGAYIAKLAASSFVGEKREEREERVWTDQKSARGRSHKHHLFHLSGAAAIKYGSLALDAPFHPDPVLAAVMVVGPPLAAAAWMAANGD